MSELQLSSQIVDVASYLPEKQLTNKELSELFPDWPEDKIFEKTGIKTRAIAADSETASDMAYEAAKKLFLQGKCKPKDIDFIILCTQAPDYILPTTACILQDRLEIPTSAGALDVNLGCSGFVYCLSLAKGLIETGLVENVLLLTADTYSKYIHPLDKSVRTLFGDGACATLISRANTQFSGIGPFVFGSDGRGAKNLIVKAGLTRLSLDQSRLIEYDGGAYNNLRSDENLYMNGAEVMSFTLQVVPKLVNELLIKANLEKEDVDYFIFHQANKFLLDALMKKINISPEKMPFYMERCGNTVSSTIPLVLENMLCEGQLKSNMKLMLVGFGVGYSWAGVIVNF